MLQAIKSFSGSVILFVLAKFILIFYTHYLYTHSFCTKFFNSCIIFKQHYFPSFFRTVIFYTALFFSKFTCCLIHIYGYGDFCLIDSVRAGGFFPPNYLQFGSATVHSSYVQ